ncbi:hypothetical protein GLS40_11725 [Pseudooceanicola sp. 216_PA32_1]|uniref:DUF1468 domain-containing protein n=1 Tax=Pseudooceanicola pacificus TaxID=2676438 RepID=A0A844WCH1_9RHOB|nr:tripartite tricarboxylate transporter TctB family protein [Pseudooceanicola pacificus]MWB78698.1 hypothetical protein [Pseudooceanicola pacificus]
MSDATVAGGVITLDRISGTLVALGGLWLLAYGIDAHIEVHGYESPSPQLFPRLGAWILLIFGLAQVVLTRTTSELPGKRVLGRYALVSAMLVGMVWLMEHFGFVIGAMAMTGTLMLVVYERRPLWLLVAVIAVPVSLWFIFEILLERPLP